MKTNTRAKMVFSVSDSMEMYMLERASGEELVEGRSITGTEQHEGFSDEFPAHDTESVKPRITTTDILSVNDHPLDFFLQVSRGSGYTQFGGLPIRVRAAWPIEYSVYRQRATKEPWPDFHPYEMEQGEGTMGDQSPDEIDRKQAAWSKQFDALLKSLFEQYEKASKGESGA